MRKFLLFVGLVATMAIANTTTTFATNDPSGCEPQRYWAAEYPHYCIDKPSTQPSVAATQATQSSKKKVTSSTTWRDNPYGCNISSQWIRADNFQCLNKDGSLVGSTRTSVAARVTAPKPTPAATNYSGTKQQWMTAAGIPQSEWASVDFIVTRESSWNPNAVNPNGGACGLGQQLPCGKWAGAWNDPVAALRAQHGYVKARYGGYAQAVAFWQINHWY